MSVSIISLASLVISLVTLLYVMWHVYQTDRNLSELRALREEQTRKLLQAYDRIATLMRELEREKARANIQEHPEGP